MKLCRHLIYMSLVLIAFCAKFMYGKSFDQADSDIRPRVKEEANDGLEPISLNPEPFAGIGIAYTTMYLLRFAFESLIIVAIVWLLLKTFWNAVLKAFYIYYYV